MMNTILLITSLLASFTLGLSVGLQIKRIVDGLYTTIRDLQHTQHKKNSGVVRPGIGASMPASADASGSSSKSAVVRPRPPKSDNDDTIATLNTVRSRVTR